MSSNAVSYHSDRLPRRTARWVTAVCILLATAASGMVQADARKPTRPDPKSLAAVNSAVTALLKECQPQAAKPALGKPAQPATQETAKFREKSDYFTEKPDPDVTPEALLAVLEKSKVSPDIRDPKIDAYVRWQLLSGLVGQWPDPLVTRAIAVYRRAPEPVSNPGLDKGRLRSLIYRVGVMKKDKMDDLNKEFGDTVQKANDDNKYILLYRKDLYGRLPVSREVLLAGLEDVGSRIQHGIFCGDQFQAIAGSIQSWSLTADARQRDSVMQVLNRLVALVRDDRCKPYVKVVWNDDKKNYGLQWQDAQVVEDNRIQGIIDSMKEAAKLMGK